MKEKIDLLTEKLNQWNKAYYEDDAPTVSDAEYDRALRELMELEAAYPHFAHGDSPTLRVGGSVAEAFSPVEHIGPLLSLANAFSYEELLDFHNRIIKAGVESPAYILEWKIDGLTVALEYENGKLIKGATRGNGRIGENITANLKTIKTVPLTIPSQEHLLVRGEAYLPKKDFLKLNRRREEEGQPLFANPRNAAAGSLRQLDPKITAKRPLAVFAYDIVYSSGDHLPRTQKDTLEFLAKQGFSVDPRYQYIEDIEELPSIIEKRTAERQDLNYDVDGLVLKLNDFRYRELLGYTAKAPRFAMAYKFPAEEKETLLKNIEISLGRTGVLTPLGILVPVTVAGSVVSKVSLHNEDYLKEKDIRVGDTVVIHKAGDVIPEVVSVVTEKRPEDSKPFVYPDTCPVCGGKAVQYEGEVAVRCINESCPGRLKENIKHFVSKGAMDIEGLGPAIVTTLMEKGFIHNVVDIYNLHSHKEELTQLEKMGAKSVENLLAAIEKSKVAGLSRVLFALGIRHVGSVTADTIAEHFGSMDKLLEAIDANESSQWLGEIEDIGTVIAESLYLYLNDPENRNVIKGLSLQGVSMEAVKIQSGNKLEGQTFLFTGTLQSLKRQEAEAMVKAEGGKILGSVSKNLQYLVVGENPGSKLTKAQKLNVTVMTEAEFLEYIK
ncbi:MAG: NAD-dependent DNA ligase LigA [Bacillota bacterium]|nr:NAD-dependent DNA ligase LigA [Bacillota bacterium]